MSAPEPSHFCVLDLETSGLDASRPVKFPYGRHTPGTDPDCILEVGFVVLDAKTLEIVDEGWSAVVPPGLHVPEETKTPLFQGTPASCVVTTPASWGKQAAQQFDEWCEFLKARNPYVFEMHTKNGLLDFIKVHCAGATPESLVTCDKVERDLIKRFTPLVGDVQPSGDGRAHLNPGNSPLVFAGNSSSNLDVPMMKLWMPTLFNMFSYRIQDVSVMRMFYNDIARIEMPEGLNEYIKSGGGKDVVHRALDDAKHCAHALKRLVGYARDVARDASVYQREVRLGSIGGAS